MRCFWEQMGALGPIYRLLGKGLNDSDIANELDLTFRESGLPGSTSGFSGLPEL